MLGRLQKLDGERAVQLQLQAAGWGWNGSQIHFRGWTWDGRGCPSPSAVTFTADHISGFTCPPLIVMDSEFAAEVRVIEVHGLCGQFHGVVRKGSVGVCISYLASWAIAIISLCLLGFGCCASASSLARATPLVKMSVRNQLGNIGRVGGVVLLGFWLVCTSNVFTLPLMSVKVQWCHRKPQL